MRPALSDSDWLALAARRLLSSQPGRGAANSDRVAFYLPDLEDGGAQKMTLRLAHAFAERGYRVDLVVNGKRGVNVAAIPDSVRAIELGRARRSLATAAAICAFPRDWRWLVRARFARRKAVTHLRYLPRLASYIQRVRPAVVIANMWSCNLNLVWARALAGSSSRVCLTERNTLSIKLADERVGKRRRGVRPASFYALVGRVYARADARITVSDGVADDLAQTTGLERTSIQTVYNPVVAAELAELAAEPVAQPWFQDDGPPVVIAVGRLHAQKNYGGLIDAFAAVRRQRQARLLILGEGRQRPLLEAKIAAHGLGDDAWLPGYDANPYRYLQRARVFVLSSIVEGMPNALIEALACGTPVVATDCPHGPREILAGGAIDRLVPVDDSAALAAAIVASIDDPGDAAARRRRAAEFSLAGAVAAYKQLVDPALAGAAVVANPRAAGG